MAYAEFPSANMHEYDLHELMCMYSKLVSEYSGLLNDISELNTKLNKYQNSVNTTLPSMITQEVNRQIYMLISKVNELQNTVTKNYKILSDSIDTETELRKRADNNLYDLINSNFALIIQWKDQFTKLIQEMQSTFEDKLEIQKVYLMGRDWTIRRELLDMIQGLSNDIDAIPENSIPVTNPVTGKPSTTTDALRDLWNYASNWMGFTCGEWMNASYITCEYWNHRNLSVTDFFTHGKFDLRYFYEQFHVWSYITGKFVPIQEAIYEIYNAIKVDAITAQDYDNKQITADTFDASNISAVNYDLDGKEIITNV